MIWFKNSSLQKIISLLIAFTFISTSIVPPSMAQSLPAGQAGVLNLPLPGAVVNLTPGYSPMLIRGVMVHPEDSLKFDFIMDKGDQGLEGDAFNKEANKLVKYFLASLTIPENQMWVNLSPYEKDRIIPGNFSQTEMGRDLLAQDYMLKQLTASLMMPDKDLGDKFWKRVRAKAKEKFGTEDIALNTFNKIWIVPEKAQVYENQKGAFVVSSHLKVMLEEDYLALEANKNSKEHGLGNVKTEDLKPLTALQKDIIKEVLIPEIEKEVNEGKTFANLRQIYSSMILATWYKKALKESLLGKVYVDKAKLKGVEVDDKEITQKIYNQYIDAFKKGVYDYIKEDYDPVTQQVIPRKYFSGGVNLSDMALIAAPTVAFNDILRTLPADHAVLVTTRTEEIPVKSTDYRPPPRLRSGQAVPSTVDGGLRTVQEGQVAGVKGQGNELRAKSQEPSDAAMTGQRSLKGREAALMLMDKLKELYETKISKGLPKKDWEPEVMRAVKTIARQYGISLEGLSDKQDMIGSLNIEQILDQMDYVLRYMGVIDPIRKQLLEQRLFDLLMFLSLDPSSKKLFLSPRPVGHDKMHESVWHYLIKKTKQYRGKEKIEIKNGYPMGYPMLSGTRVWIGIKGKGAAYSLAISNPFFFHDMRERYEVRFYKGQLEEPNHIIYAREIAFFPEEGKIALIIADKDYDERLLPDKGRNTLRLTDQTKRKASAQDVSQKPANIEIPLTDGISVELVRESDVTGVNFERYKNEFAFSFIDYPETVSQFRKYKIDLARQMEMLGYPKETDYPFEFRAFVRGYKKDYVYLHLPSPGWIGPYDFLFEVDQYDPQTGKVTLKRPMLQDASGPLERDDSSGYIPLDTMKLEYPRRGKVYSPSQEFMNDLSLKAARAVNAVEDIGKEFNSKGRLAVKKGRYFLAKGMLSPGVGEIYLFGKRDAFRKVSQQLDNPNTYNPGIEFFKDGIGHVVLAEAMSSPRDDSAMMAEPLTDQQAKNRLEVLEREKGVPAGFTVAVRGQTFSLVYHSGNREQKIVLSRVVQFTYTYSLTVGHKFYFKRMDDSTGINRFLYSAATLSKDGILKHVSVTADSISKVVNKELRSSSANNSPDAAMISSVTNGQWPVVSKLNTDGRTLTTKEDAAMTVEEMADKIKEFSDWLGQEEVNINQLESPSGTAYLTHIRAIKSDIGMLLWKRDRSRLSSQDLHRGMRALGTLSKRLTAAAPQAEKKGYQNALLTASKLKAIILIYTSEPIDEAMTAKSPIQLSYAKLKQFGIHRLTYGSQAFIETKENWPFMLKLFRDEPEERIFSEETIRSYEVAERRLGGLVPDFVLFDLHTSGNSTETASIMRKVRLYDITTQMRTLMTEGKINELKSLIQKKVASVFKIIRRGVFPIDAKFENFGLINDHLVLLDPGHAEETYDDGSLRNLQRLIRQNYNFLVYSLGSDELGQFYLDTLQSYGLDQESILDTLKENFGKDSPVIVPNISDEIRLSLGDAAMTANQLSHFQTLFSNPEAPAPTTQQDDHALLSERAQEGVRQVYSAIDDLIGQVEQHKDTIASLNLIQKGIYRISGIYRDSNERFNLRTRVVGVMPNLSKEVLIRNIRELNEAIKEKLKLDISQKIIFKELVALLVFVKELKKKIESESVVTIRHPDKVVESPDKQTQMIIKENSLGQSAVVKTNAGEVDLVPARSEIKQYWVKNDEVRVLYTAKVRRENASWFYLVLKKDNPKPAKYLIGGMDLKGRLITFVQKIGTGSLVSIVNASPVEGRRYTFKVVFKVGLEEPKTYQVGLDVRTGQLLRPLVRVDTAMMGDRDFAYGMFINSTIAAKSISDMGQPQFFKRGQLTFYETVMHYLQKNGDFGEYLVQLKRFEREKYPRQEKREELIAALAAVFGQMTDYIKRSSGRLDRMEEYLAQLSIIVNKIFALDAPNIFEDLTYPQFLTIIDNLSKEAESLEPQRAQSLHLVTGIMNENNFRALMAQLSSFWRTKFIQQWSLMQIMELARELEVPIARKDGAMIGEGKTVLLVDDQELLLLTFRVILQRKGFTVVTASSREEALEKFRAGHYDVVISDKQMPGNEDGVLLALDLKREGSTTPFILHSTVIKEDGQARAIVMGNQGISVAMPKDLQGGKKLISVLERIFAGEIGEEPGEKISGDEAMMGAVVHPVSIRLLEDKLHSMGIRYEHSNFYHPDKTKLLDYLVDEIIHNPDKNVRAAAWHRFVDTIYLSDAGAKSRAYVVGYFKRLIVKKQGGLARLEELEKTGELLGIIFSQKPTVLYIPSRDRRLSYRTISTSDIRNKMINFIHMFQQQRIEKGDRRQLKPIDINTLMGYVRQANGDGVKLARLLTGPYREIYDDEDAALKLMAEAGLVAEVREELLDGRLITLKLREIADLLTQEDREFIARNNADHRSEVRIYTVIFKELEFRLAAMVQSLDAFGGKISEEAIESRVIEPLDQILNGKIQLSMRGERELRNVSTAFSKELARKAQEKGSKVAVRLRDRLIAFQKGILALRNPYPKIVRRSALKEVLPGRANDRAMMAEKNQEVYRIAGRVSSVLEEENDIDKLNETIEQLRKDFNEGGLEEHIGSFDFMVAHALLPVQGGDQFIETATKVLLLKNNFWILLYMLNNLSMHLYTRHSSEYVHGRLDLADFVVIEALLPSFLAQYIKKDRSGKLSSVILEHRKTHYQSVQERQLALLTLSNIFLITQIDDGEFWNRLVNVLKKIKDPQTGEDLSSEVVLVLKEILKTRWLTKYGLNTQMRIMNVINTKRLIPSDDFYHWAISLFGNGALIYDWQKSFDSRLRERRFEKFEHNFFRARGRHWLTKMTSDWPRVKRIRKMINELTATANARAMTADRKMEDIVTAMRLLSEDTNGEFHIDPTGKDNELFVHWFVPGKSEYLRFYEAKNGSQWISTFHVWEEGDRFKGLIYSWDKNSGMLRFYREEKKEPILEIPWKEGEKIGIHFDRATRTLSFVFPKEILVNIRNTGWMGQLEINSEKINTRLVADAAMMAFKEKLQQWAQHPDISILKGGKRIPGSSENEILALVDEDGRKLAATEKRADVHAQGLWHMTSHIYVFDQKGRLLLQKRSQDKKLSPGKLQVSVSGHVDASEDENQAALREGREEIGIELDPARLKTVTRYKRSQSLNDGENNEFVHVYAYTVNDQEVAEIQRNYNLNESDELWFVPVNQLGPMMADVAQAFSNTLNDVLGQGNDVWKKILTVQGIDAAMVAVEDILKNDLAPIEKKLPIYGPEYANKQEWVKRNWDLWLEVLKIAEENKLVAHGTGNFLYSEGVKLSDSSSHHRWALLGIMITGAVFSEHPGSARDLLKASRIDTGLSSAAYGPFYVIYKSWIQPSQYIKGDQRNNHAIYLVPDAAEKEFFVAGINKAVEKNLMSRLDADDALSKLMTFGELIDHKDRIQEIIDGQVTPAKAVADAVRSAGKTPDVKTITKDAPDVERLSQAERIVEDVIGFKRTEPEEVLGVSYGDLEQAMIKARRYHPGEYEHSLAFQELNSILPYVKEMVDQVLKDFSGYHILVLGRDADIFYDALRMVHPQPSKIILLPGSSPIWGDLKDDILDDELGYPLGWRKSFLSSYGITKEAIERGEKFLVLDTGFEGSIGKDLRELVRKELGLSRGQIMQLPEIFPIRLVSYEPWIPDSKEDENIRQIKDFIVPKADFPNVFPRFSQEWPELFDQGFNKVLASALQVLPSFHGRYSIAKMGPSGTFIGGYDDIPLISWNIDAIYKKVNISIVNPFAALLIQKKVVDYFRQSYSSSFPSEKAITTSASQIPSETPDVAMVANPADSGQRTANSDLTVNRLTLKAKEDQAMITTTTWHRSPHDVFDGYLISVEGPLNKDILTVTFDIPSPVDAPALAKKTVQIKRGAYFELINRLEELADDYFSSGNPQSLKDFQKAFSDLNTFSEISQPLRLVSQDSILDQFQKHDVDLKIISKGLKTYLPSLEKRIEADPAFLKEYKRRWDQTIITEKSKMSVALAANRFLDPQTKNSLSQWIEKMIFWAGKEDQRVHVKNRTYLFVRILTMFLNGDDAQTLSAKLGYAQSFILEILTNLRLSMTHKMPLPLYPSAKHPQLFHEAITALTPEAQEYIQERMVAYTKGDRAMVGEETKTDGTRIMRVEGVKDLETYFVRQGVFDSDNDLLEDLIHGRKSLIVMGKLGAAIEAQIREYVKKKLPDAVIVEMEGGEQSKSFDNVLQLTQEAVTYHIGKGDGVVVAIGGAALIGAVGTFASLYERGMPWIRIPTTLIGQVDVGVSKKVGINFGEERNLLGAEHPGVSIIDTRLLATVPEQHQRSGLAEILKIALVSNPDDLFSQLEQYFPQILKGESFDSLNDIVYKTAKEHIEQVARDSLGGVKKRPINLGHIIAHTFEIESKGELAHGEAVAMEILFFTHIANQRGILNNEDFNRIVRLYKKIGFQVSHPLINRETIVEGFKRSKRHKGSLDIVIPAGIGRVEYIGGEEKTEPSVDEIDAALAFLKSLPEDAAMVGGQPTVDSGPKTKGGIDLNPNTMNMQIKRDGNGVPLPLNLQPIDNINIEGFQPIIINVAPIHNLPLLLGIKVNPNEPIKTSKAENTELGYLDKSREVELVK